MNLFKRLAALLLAAVLIIGLFPVGALAAEQESIEFITTYVNPRYADIFSEEDIPPFCGHRAQTYATPKYVTTAEEASVILRQQMKDRIQPAVVYMYLERFDSEEAVEALSHEIIDQALMHTGDPVEGDYLAWQHGDGKIGCSGKYNSETGGYNFTFTYDLPYYTTAAEELQVDSAVSKLLSDLNLSGKTDYEKVKAIYDYICANVRYDKAHLDDKSYVHQFTAYAALMDGKAVCQGYALLLYRLALELGIDNRFIGGSTSNGDHGWNIIELDNLYYNADATWDEGQTNYSWFLKSPANFPNHTRFEEYDTSAFHSAYPMASADYVPHNHNYRTTVTAPTCTEQGYTTYTCDCGHTYQDNFVTATGHTFGSWHQTVAPTETAAGQERRDCEKCDHFETKTVEKLAASNPSSGSCGDNLTWSFNETSGKLSVSGSGAMYGADKLGWTAFAGDIRSVEIGSGATSVGAYAFADCTNLKDVRIPTSVMSIAYNAFENCSSLSAVEIPANVTEISYGSFMDCTSLASVVLPQNVTAIAYHAFDNCTSLSEVDFPSSLASIQDEAFNNCGSLDEMSFSGNAPAIQSNAFSKVTADAYYPASNTTWTEDVRQNYGGTLTWKAFCQNGHTWNAGVVTREPTETTPGIRTYTCTGCGETRTEEIPVLEHKHSYTTVVTEPTCTEDGFTTHTCPCGDTYTDSIVPAPGHTEVIDQAVPATCTSTGLTEGKRCSVCKNTLVAQTEIPMTDHAWNDGAVTKQPTETETGIRTYTCQNCKTTKTEEIPALEHEHSYTTVVTEPTCTEDGFTTHTCPCGDIYTDNIVPALGHTEVIDQAVPATCTSTGLTEGKRCSVCKNTLVAQTEIPMTDHAWNDGAVTKQPTETETGIRTYTCQNCKTTKTEEIPVLEHEHSYTTVVTDPTCTEEGFTTHTCPCGDIYTDNIVPALGHSLGDWVTQGNKQERSCSRCSYTESKVSTDVGDVEIESTEQSDLNFDVDHVEPTDEQYILVEEALDETGNSGQEIIKVFDINLEDTNGVHVQPSGTVKVKLPLDQDKDGAYKVYRINDDGSLTDMNAYRQGSHMVFETDHFSLYVIVEETEHQHNYQSSVTAPTCTEEGFTTYTCFCGDTYINNEVDSLGHDWDEGIVTKEPTTTAPGVMTYTCERCGEKMEEEIATLQNVQRVYGQDRIETALAVAEELKAVLNVEKFDSIILAAGGSGSDQTKFADALSGSYLATSKKAPILLYTKGNISPKNLAFIEENLSANGTIYLLGGNVSIPVEVEEALNAEGYNTKRLGGTDRYDTNLIILQEANVDDAEEILIASGLAFADSLSASATGLPIMLVNGSKSKLTDAQVEFLQSVKGKKITILGGTAAVTAELETAINEAAGIEADRIFGDARENTSAMVAKKYFAEADTALIAYSRMYPDGLAGGVLANALKAPLLLTKAGSESIANEYIEASGISSGYVLGGTAVLTDDTARAVFGLSNDVIISTK